jgi:hypothetical protein
MAGWSEVATTKGPFYPLRAQILLDKSLTSRPSFPTRAITLTSDSKFRAIIRAGALPHATAPTIPNLWPLPQEYAVYRPYPLLNWCRCAAGKRVGGRVWME